MTNINPPHRNWTAKDNCQSPLTSYSSYNCGEVGGYRCPRPENLALAAVAKIPQVSKAVNTP